MSIDVRNRIIQHEVDLYLADNAMSPRQLADRCYLAGLEAAKGKVLELNSTRHTSEGNARNTVIECQQAIDQLIKEAK